MKLIRNLLAILMALNTNILNAIETGRYVVSLTEVDGGVASGLLLDIHSDADGVRAKVHREGYNCEAKIQITSNIVGSKTSEVLSLIITLVPTQKDQSAQTYLLTGTTRQKQGGDLKFDTFKGKALLSEDGDGTFLRFLMSKATAKTDEN
jgi:hypothetical protein